MLMRWVENWARNKRLLAIDLFSIEERVGFYQGLGYEVLGEKPLQLGKEVYIKMRRKLLYNLNPPSPMLEHVKRL
jgi:hypothetical protein